MQSNSLNDLSSWWPILRSKWMQKMGSSSDYANFDSQLFPEAGGVSLVPSLVAEKKLEAIPEAVAQKYLNFEFSIFGEDWCSFLGANGFSWHEDKVTAYEWPLKAKYELSVFPQKGVDIKFPWEFGRLHPLPQLAYFHFHGANAEKKLEIETFFQKVVGDFLKQNPVGKGVQWFSSMDVAIRLVNLVVAYDLLRASGYLPAKDFSEQFSRLIWQHGKYLFDHLDWYREGRGNHYLANLAGLVYAALWLGKSKESDGWLGFAIAELQKEGARQFYPDGGNFEGSTHYHRLSLELFGYPLSAVLHAGEKRISPEKKKMIREKFFPVVDRALVFLESVVFENGELLQIGDNDSGRLLNIAPKFEGIHERVLNVRETLQILRAEFPKSTSPQLIKIKNSRADISGKKSVYHEFALSKAICLDQVEIRSFPDFGLHVWKTEGFFLAIRCGKPSGDGHGGHAHFDQLHLELRTGDEVLTEDPGTFTYSRDKDARNFFRGPQAHFIPRLPNLENLVSQAEDLFRYRNLPLGEVQNLGATDFCGFYTLGSARIFRKVEIQTAKIVVTDWAEGEGSEDLVSSLPDLPFRSLGYGRKLLRNS
jgi:hypothetical protein